MSALLILACTDSVPPTRPGRLGANCDTSDQCESGLCDRTYNECTAPCSDVEPCPSRLSCTRGFCRDLCRDGETQYETELVCFDGVWIPCAEADPALACAGCGCDVFGGGFCVDGVGCEAPRANGEPCTDHEQCESGACFAGDGRCGPPLALGARCESDAECATHNCGQYLTAARYCMQEFGTPCEDSGEDCEECLTLGDGGRICGRRFCSFTAGCPQLAGRGWSCDLSASRCHQVCSENEATDCVVAGYSCALVSDDYCTRF